MTAKSASRPFHLAAMLAALLALSHAYLASGALAQEAPKPATLPVDEMRAVAYTSAFAKRFSLPELAPSERPTGGLEAIEFYVEKGPPWASQYYYCRLKLYVDNKLPIAYPEASPGGAKRLLLYAQHFFLWPDPENRRWFSFSEADRKHHADRQSAYDGLAAIATLDYEFQKRGAYDDIGLDEYYREIFPGISYVQLSTACFSQRKLSQRSEWQLLLKKEGGRDYRRHLRVHAEDFVKFPLPQPFLQRLIALSEQGNRYNEAVHELELKLRRERSERLGPQKK